MMISEESRRAICRNDRFWGGRQQQQHQTAHQKARVHGAPGPAAAVQANATTDPCSRQNTRTKHPAEQRPAAAVASRSKEGHNAHMLIPPPLRIYGATAAAVAAAAAAYRSSSSSSSNNDKKHG
ncbi:unnamed protein product [Ectocarpus sp. 4 AP-2014]